MDHLKLTLARQLGGPLTAAKGSGMKQKGCSKPVQCMRMRIITELEHCTTGGLTSGGEKPLQTHICSSRALAPRAPGGSPVKPH